MAASLLSDAATSALRTAFGRAVQQHAPAFLLPGLTAAPARSRLLIDAAIGVLVDTVTGFLRIALWAAFLVVVLAVLLLVLFASCALAAAAIAVYLDRAGASRSRVRRLAALAFVLLFLLTVVVFSPLQTTVRSEDMQL